MARLRWDGLVGTVAAVVISASCFSDTGAPIGDSTSAGTGSECPPGSQACACYGNQTCDDGLVCAEGVACFPEDCVPGTENCPCLDNGGCDVGLTCNGMACTPEGSSGTSGTSTTSMPTSAGPGTTTSTSDGTDSGESTGSIRSCEPEDGDPFCVTCAKNNCCARLDACLSDPQCQSMLDCVEPGDPFGTCAVDNGGGGEAFGQLALCAAMAPMPEMCTGCAPPTLACLGPDLGFPIAYHPCTECAALQCCDQLNACKNNGLCACVEACVSDPAPPNGYDSCLAGPCSKFSTGSAQVYNALSNCVTASGCNAALNCYPLTGVEPM